MKNIFVIPLAAAFVLLGGALCLPPVQALQVLLGFLGLASAVAAVFLARVEGKKDISLLLEPIEDLRQNKNPVFPEKISENLKPVIIAVKAIAEARDAALETALSKSAEADEYKKQLEDELAGKDKILAEQEKFRHSLRHNSHRTRMVYGKLAGEIHYLSQMVADIGHSMETQKSGMRQNDAVVSEIAASLRAFQESAKEGLSRVEKMAVAAIADSSKLKGQKPVVQMTASVNNALEELRNVTASLEAQAEIARDAHTAAKELHDITRDASAQMIEFTGRLVSIARAVEDLEIATSMLSGLREDEATERSRIVEWSPSLATGIELIDYQHKMLCLYINTLYRATMQEAGVKEIADIVDFLKVYTATHFATEERYFELSQYPDAEAHKQIHASFVSKVIQVQKDLYSGKITVGNDLLKFLKDWLVNHIRGTDHEYASFLKAYLAKAKDK